MKINSKQADWLVIITLAAAVVAYVSFVFLPTRRATGQLQEQITEKQETIDQGGLLVQGLQATQKELEETLEYNSAWREGCPSGGVSLLHAKIHELATSTGTSITRFDPEDGQDFGILREIPLSVGCTGDFWAVFDFLRKVESLNATVWINKVLLEKMDMPEGSVKCEIGSVVFTNNPENSDYVKHSE